MWVHVLGCRSNLYEGEALAGELEARGASISEHPEGCRVAVLVSCSVTGAADRKCRQAVRRARRGVGATGVVAVCGCWAQGFSHSGDEARALGIDILVGNRLKSALPDALEAALENRTGGSGTLIDLRRNLDGASPWDPLALNRTVLHTRAFLKVQEGCDHFCSYCVIPFLRGRSTSRPLADALDEVRRVVDAGCREVVLTGIHLGMYGRDLGISLARLVREISALTERALPGLVRLRLGSLEPFALDEELLDTLAGSPVFCPHLHLPLQSGDDGVLARMRRGHTADDFARICERAREKLGDELHISSDVLVAFPGESEEAFANTLFLMTRAGVGRAHVFPYSPRRGTAAAAFGDRVPARLAAERVARAMELGGQLLQRYASRFVGRDLSLLMEDDSRGYTRHFVAASVRTEGGAPVEAGREVEVRMTDCSKGELEGWRRPA